MAFHQIFTSKLLASATLGGLVIGAAGCVHEHHHRHHDEVIGRYDYEAYPQHEVVIVEPPPREVYEVEPRPRPGYVWIRGYYVHDRDHYAWRPGRFEPEPRRGARWESGRWEQRRGGYAWRDGNWR